MVLILIKPMIKGFAQYKEMGEFNFSCDINKYHNIFTISA